MKQIPLILGLQLTIILSANYFPHWLIHCLVYKLSEIHEKKYHHNWSGPSPTNSPKQEDIQLKNIWKTEKLS